jgi:hypothetical protein
MSEQNIKQNQDINIEIFKEQEQPQKEILLKLGDIILISDPTNEILNDNVFFIEYIDTNKIKLINSNTFEKVVLHISPDRIIGDGNIQSITILSSNPESGYARQNELLPGTWINIYFGGDIPSVITGKITNLEEDMIEIQTIDNDTIYINFAYQGIPEDLPIETFEIRPPIDIDKQDELQLQTQEETEGEEKQSEPIKVNKKIQNRINLGDIEFGDVFKVEEYVNIDKDKYRYNIDAQTNDLLEDMISNIPTNKRTNNVLNSIHVMITRFLQLREISSIFDKNKNITGIIIPTAQDRPLAEYLSEFKNTLYWIMLVAKNTKKIYQDEEIINDDTAVNEYDDVVKINMDSDLKELSNLFKTIESARYFKPRHLNYTYKSFDTLMTPFNSVNPSEENNVFTVSNGIIVEGNVESDINVIIDNLGDFYSSVAIKSEASKTRLYTSEIVSRRFVIQKYNLAAKKLHATNFKGQHLIANRVKVTENDPISINSIVTLPEPAVQFSHINLPGSNLLVKSNLNLHFLNYWQILKQKTNVTSVPIVGLDTELEYDEINFVDNIKQYFLNLTEYKKPNDISNADIYKIFLKTIIPKTLILFSLVKKYIKGRLSLVEVVNYMEPFKIYPSDLTYNQYREINKFIYNKIKEYNSTFKEYNMAFSYLKNTGFQNKKTSDIYYFQNPLFNLLESTKYQPMKAHVMEIYGFSEPKISISGSEFLKLLITSDFGNLFNTAIALINTELMFPTNLSEVFNQDKDRLKKIMDNNKNEDKCTTFIIAKKYVSKESLIADNEKPIYYDKEYDTTNYDLIDQKYKKEKNNLSHEDFIMFLTDVLQRKDKLSEMEAEYMATTLANQAKQVREGDYAILVTTSSQFEETMADQMEYYIRNNNVWVLDDKVDPNVFIKDDDILCNINYNCIYNPVEKSEDKCESISVSKTTAIQNALNKIIEQFDSNYEISKTELNSTIMKELIYFEKIFNKFQKIKKTQFYKYNDIQYELGLSVSNEIIDRVVSPYIKLRDLIMGQNDFIKKQNDIIQFVSLYCYEGNPSTPNIIDGEMENEWWFYCKDTNTKLLPKFHHILASTFINNNSKYDEVLNDLKRTIGKRSDDGDAWVDENSGEIICYIDLDVTEGYKDGFVDKSRAIIEKDEGEIMLERYTEKGKQEVKRLSAEGEIISNIVSTISDNMGIDIEQSREFIIRVVTEFMSDTNIIKSKTVYNKIVQEKNKKGQTMMPYSEYYGSIILYLTLGVYLIAVQTSIPSIKTRKTAPGCVRSFTGFPFEGEGDDSSVEYLACVALKSRDKSIFPWNALQKTKQKDIVSTIKTTIIKIKNYQEIQQKISLKTEYLLINPEEIIPDEHNLTKWINFLPPLKRFHVKNLTNVSSGFEKELGNDLRMGSSRQLEKILVIKSKIIAFSLAIQEQIQSLVERKNLLMKSGGQLFMDNACCNEDSNIKITTLEYFANDDKNIELYNNVVAKLSSTMRDINLITNAKIMLSKENSKRAFPAVSNIFSEETIYYAFIMLCKFQTETPLMPELLSICNEKPDYLKKMDTIQEKITKLKNDGRIYTNEQFLRLFQIVSRHNIINISFESSTKSCIHKLEQLLHIFNVKNDENVPKPLVEQIQALVSTYDLRITEDNEHMRTLKNYLQTSIEGMKKELITFLIAGAKLTKKEIDNLVIFIKEMSVWSSKRNTDQISDDALNNYVNFMKNFIKMFVITFPSIIINKKEYDIVYGESWGISQEHYQDLKQKISKFYKPLEKFYANANITKVLEKISKKSDGIYLLSKNTPVLSNIKIDDTIFYNSFDTKITMLLYEYYLLSVLTDYISLTQHKNMISRVLSKKSKIASSLDVDFLAQDQSRFADEENEFISGNILSLTQDIAKLLAEYLKIMMKSKSMINMSYDDIADKIFKLKEAEKYDFTDKLRDMTDEQRKVDNIMKYNKLEFYGMFDDIRGYNDEHFKHDKQIAENVAKIQNKFGQVDDDLMNDDEYENEVNQVVAEDNAVESDHDEDMNDYDNADNDYAYNDYEYD